MGNYYSKMKRFLGLERQEPVDVLLAQYEYKIKLQEWYKKTPTRLKPKEYKYRPSGDTIRYPQTFFSENFR